MVEVIADKKTGLFSKKPGSRSSENTNRLVDDDGWYKSTVCPECDRRVFDVYKQSVSIIIIRLKCPHCRKIVRIALY